MTYISHDSWINFDKFDVIWAVWTSERLKEYVMCIHESFNNHCKQIHWTLDRQYFDVISTTWTWGRQRCVHPEWSFIKHSTYYSISVRWTSFWHRQLCILGNPSPNINFNKHITSSSWNSDNRIVIYIYFGAIQNQLDNGTLEHTFYYKSPTNWWCRMFDDIQVHKKKRCYLQHMRCLRNKENIFMITNIII